MKVSDERAEKALRYLAETDEPCASLRSDMERAEYRAKAIRDAAFRRLEGSVADRQAHAATLPDYDVAMKEYFDRLREYEAMRNKRQTEALVCELWRSINANRRAGNV